MRSSRQLRKFEIPNSKYQIRNTKQIQMKKGPNDKNCENINRLFEFRSFEFLKFQFVSDFDIRISDLVFRIFLLSQKAPCARIVARVATALWFL